jgi:hypothetical protein
LLVGQLREAGGQGGPFGFPPAALPFLALLRDFLEHGVATEVAVGMLTSSAGEDDVGLVPGEGDWSC